MKVLIAAPVRQTEKIFKAYLKSLRNLGEYDKMFIFNNCDFSHLLKKNEKGMVAETEDEYQNHKWENSNLQTVATLKNYIMANANDYDYIFFVDSDTLLHPKVLDNLLSHKKDIISPMLFSDWGSGVQNPNCWDIDHYSFFPGNLEKYRKKGCYKVGGTGGCILISKKVFSKINYSYLPNVSFWGEDRHFCIKAYAHGFEIWCTNEYPVEHIYRPEMFDECVANWKSWK